MLRAFIIFLLTILPFSPITAQSDPALYILNPGGYVRPGEAFEIHAELVNPADSGVVIYGITGGGRSGGGGSVWENPIDREALMQEQQAIRLMQRERRREGFLSGYPVVAGAFPLNPGESLQFIIYEDQMPSIAQPGQDIRFRNLRIKLDTDNFVSGEVYADSNIVRIASADGQGDERVFSSMDLGNAQAGTMVTDLHAEFTYPPNLQAGASFTMEATVTNWYSEQVMLITGGMVMQGGFREWQGEHARSYRFIECGQTCQTPQETTLEPGESISWQLGTFYYENENLFSGELVLDGFTLSVMDHLGRHEIRDIASDPVTISVLASGRNPRLDSSQAPAKALQQRDLYRAGDQMLVFDPNTGYEWLKLTAGEGYSPQDILEATRSNGAFAGFRLASSQEVETLYLNHMNASGVELRDYSVYEMVFEVQPLQQFVGLLGNIPTVNESLGFSGIVNDQLPSRQEPGALYTVLTMRVTNRPAAQAMMVAGDQGLRKARRRLDTGLEAYIGYWMVR